MVYLHSEYLTSQPAVRGEHMECVLFVPEVALLLQVGFVTAICATCFTLRAIIVAWSGIDKADADLDVWQHPLLNIVYYTIVEIVPSALVLFILRKLPPRRPQQGYQPLPAQ